MATLVLNTVGTLLGGPIGGALGSLIGQGIDQQLFGPGERHGPRIGDLSVQTSRYGSAIPQIFGTMRIAGTIIWSTDLQESSQTQSAKGQPDTVTYSYSVSLAVALSSRRIASVGRIWADGKLIRTSDGDFTVRTGFRIRYGSENQPVDPLIASIEGGSSCPAYRGVALAVFENLQLADFGNRIPFLTFEVIADPEPVPAQTVLGEASDGLIEVEAPQLLAGFAAYGATMTNAVQPLLNALNIAVVDDGTSLRSPLGEPVEPAVHEIGASAGARPAPRLQRSQRPGQSLPSALTLSYYDPERDYQTGLARASSDSVCGTAEQLELPAVLHAADAKALAETSLARTWAERDQLTLHLPPAYAGLAPGALLSPPGEATAWEAQRVTIDSFAVVVELRPVYETIATVPADSGRVAGSEAAIPGPTEVAILELPDLGIGAADAPLVAIAATSASPRWRPVPVQVDVGAIASSTTTAAAPTVLGRALTTLIPNQPCVLDLVSSVDVELTQTNDWLESCDDDALAAEANLALVGSELIQFGDAMPLGNGRFRLTRLLRARRGTDWAMDSHSAEETFALLDRSRLQPLNVSAGQIGAQIKVTPEGIADTGAAAVESTISGEAIRPPSPVHVTAWFDAAGNLHASWVRRSTRGWTWLDSVDVPLGCSVELYRVTLTGAAGAVETEAAEPQIQFTPLQLAEIGSGETLLTVVQVGDLASSRPASLTLELN